MAIEDGYESLGGPVMYEQGAELVVRMASMTIEVMQSRGEDWTSAYYRFERSPGREGSNGSFLNGDEVTLFSAFDDGVYLKAMNDCASGLLGALDKSEGVVLLTVNSDMTYKVDFDFVDLQRWKISLLDGRNGLPGD